MMIMDKIKAGDRVVYKGHEECAPPGWRIQQIIYCVESIFQHAVGRPSLKLIGQDGILPSKWFKKLTPASERANT